MWFKHPPEALSPRAEVVDENIGAYCSLDKNAQRPTRELTLQEKEEVFIEAMMVGRAGGQWRCSCGRAGERVRASNWRGRRGWVEIGAGRGAAEEGPCWGAGPSVHTRRGGSCSGPRRPARRR